MTLGEIRGQDGAISKLRRALAAGRLGHALILAGPPGVGKRTTALALARALLCRSKPGEGCRDCAECHLVEVGNHPDVFIEDLERARLERPAATLLSIDQMRRMRSQLAGRPLRGSCKIGIIEPADRTTVDAQNALLKTLEEPAGAAVLLLVATNPQALLATIRSRCQLLLFAPLEIELISERLIASGTDATLATRAAALAGGSLERARVLADAELCALGDELRGRLSQIAHRSVAELLDFAEELAGARGERAREQQDIRTAALLDWYRERMIAAARQPNDDDPEEYRANLRQAWWCLRLAHDATCDLERNANAQLTWNKLLLDLHTSG